MLFQVVALLAIGTVAGFDLVSGPQILLARPIVAGTLAGLVLGDVTTGILVGGMLELFALEVLPVGATRYPDHGPGTVAAVWYASQMGPRSAGVAVLIALAASELGGVSLQVLRRINGEVLMRMAPRLDRGERGVAGTLQLGGAARDLGRSLFLTLIALGGAAALRQWQGFSPTALRMAAIVVLGVGLAGAVAGAVRTAGHSWRGIVLGTSLVAGWVMAGLLGAFPVVR